MKHFTDLGSIFDESAPSGTQQLVKTPAQKELHRTRKAKWEQAMQVRDVWWTEADFVAEEERLQNEIAQWGNRHEA